jgi:outer membrane protein assembly complex protein YaeT
MILRLAAVAVLIFMASPADVNGFSDSLASYSGEKVLELRVEGAPIQDSEIRALIPQEAGTQLDPVAVREGINNLYRTGLYKTVKVYVREEEGGITLLYSVVPRSWLSEVEFEGNLSLTDNELLRNTDLTRSEEISESRLQENVERLRSYYLYRGFEETGISYRIVPDGDDQKKVVFEVWEGQGSFISDVLLEGDPGISRTRLLSIIASMPGEHLDGAVIDRDIEKLKRYYRERFFLTPVIRHSLSPDAQYPDGTVIAFHVERGPLFKLEVRGPDTVDEKWVRKRMNKVFRSEANVGLAREKLMGDILERFRQDGYYFTVASWTDEMTGPSERQITLSIDPGSKVIIGTLDVEGVRFFEDAEVREILGLMPDRLFIKDDLDEGVGELEKAYAMEGFLSGSVSLAPLNFIPDGDMQEVRIRIRVDEGPRTMIRNLTVESVMPDQERYKDLIGLRPGGPYVPELIGEGRDAILSDLSRRGHLYATVSLSEPVRNEDNSVDVQVNVHEGPRVRLGAVIITGNEQVNTKIIRLALDLERGDILTQDKILKAQERIYRLGVMSSVDVRLAEPQEPAAQKDLVISVRERPRYIIGMRLGYGNEDRLRGAASITYRNVSGMARALTLEGKASAIERRTSLLYNHPWFTSRPINFSASLSDIVEERDSYSRDALSASVDFTRKMSERTEVSFGYLFEGLRLFDVSPGAQLSADDEGKTDVAALLGEIIYDTRDDFLDPWSGILGDLRLEFASGSLGSRAEYYKTELAFHRYQDIGGANVLAGVIRLGGVLSYGRSEEVIISKRFFLGGQSSVRGYGLDRLGPRDDDGEPIGGNYMINANLELRYPMYKSVRGVLFLDSGSVWLQKGGDGFTLRSTAGTGLRWTSPIGPISLDYGYKLNPAEEDRDDRYRWHLSIGHAF